MTEQDLKNLASFIGCLAAAFLGGMLAIGICIGLALAP